MNANTDIKNSSNTKNSNRDLKSGEKKNDNKQTKTTTTTTPTPTTTTTTTTTTADSNRAITIQSQFHKEAYHYPYY